MPDHERGLLILPGNHPMQQARVIRSAGRFLRRGMAPLGRTRRAEKQGAVPGQVGAQIRGKAEVYGAMLTMHKRLAYALAAVAILMSLSGCGMKGEEFMYPSRTQPAPTTSVAILPAP